MAMSVWDILNARSGGSPAIGAPGRAWLDGAGLRDLVADIRRQLNAFGVGRGDRVAIVLPNGPEMATTFLAIASSATAAPLNPAYRDEEFDFYMSDLKPKLAILLADQATPARGVAERLGIPIADLHPDEGGPAGTFRLALPPVPAGSTTSGGPAQADDVALVLHTSGTTARPKIVPLSNANLAASAGNIVTTLALSPADRCLNIMPLFHIHGLMAAVLSSMKAGGAVCCTPGFNAMRFFAWLQEVRPTWYTAVPTMHQAILMRGAQNREIAREGGLRFIRSSSASLPPQVMSALEELFGAPVIEAYGMTEASHQMASNPLPPRPRKPGAVGLPAGPEMALMDEAGNLLPPGSIGEVVIRGPNVTRGYDANPEANAKAFTHGWFRTGDQGRLDEEGYLFLTGRLKELINRGGEKVSPIEVDTVLMDHPAVAQAVTFAMPHEMLGEEVAAAVVLRDGLSASEAEIRNFVGSHLAAFKVPRRVVILDEIPKGATGKMQRIGLAQKLGLGA